VSWLLLDITKSVSETGSKCFSAGLGALLGGGGGDNLGLPEPSILSNFAARIGVGGGGGFGLLNPIFSTSGTSEVGFTIGLKTGVDSQLSFPLHCNSVRGLFI
jgi:hypothetical protein